MGLKVGELFVHRNVGNVLSHSDSNAMSALEYSVKVCFASRVRSPKLLVVVHSLLRPACPQLLQRVSALRPQPSSRLLCIA